MTTLTYTGNLVVVTCWCSMAHAIPKGLRDHQEQQHRDGETQTGIYCPLGHSYIISGKGEAEKLRERLAAEQDRRAAVTADRDQVVASLRATKGQVTKLRKRVVAGACPFGCRRHFADLERHVAAERLLDELLVDAQWETAKAAMDELTAAPDELAAGDHFRYVAP